MKYSRGFKFQMDSLRLIKLKITFSDFLNNRKKTQVGKQQNIIIVAPVM